MAPNQKEARHPTLPRRKADEVRAYLLKIRTADPKLKLAEGKRRAEEHFGLEFGSGFGPTFWRRAVPGREAEPAAADAAAEEEEEAGPALQVDIYDDGSARLRLDIIDSRDVVFAIVGAVTTASGAGR